MAKKQKSVSAPVVTTDTKKDKKEKKTKKGDSPDVVEDKKPQKSNRSIVSQSSSWTGKLPASLLHEHAQKQKWNKVEYDMKRFKEGFLAIQLSYENPKTKETIIVKFHTPKDIVKPQETPLEARHFGATYALHRIAFNKNIHMVLPSNHKQLWSDLEVERKKITKENPLRAQLEYTNNPFSAVLEKRKLDDSKRKEREAREASLEKIKKPTIFIGNSKSNSSKNSLPHSESKRGDKADKFLSKPIKKVFNNTSPVTFPRKVWDHTVLIDLDSEIRISIEKSIKNHIEWSEDENVQMIKSDTSYSSNLEMIGFRKVHIDEALKYTYTFNDTLEWLIFHLPEDDLPSIFSKDEKDATVKLKISKDLKKERTIEQLCQGGFSRIEVKTYLDNNGQDLIESAVQLTNSLLPKTVNNSVTGEEIISSEEFLQEKESLMAIFQESRVLENDPINDDIYEILLKPEGLNENLLSLKVFKSRFYPFDICGLFLLVKDESYKLPNYIKVSLIKHLTRYLVENQMIGMPYIYSCIDWLETNILKIIENPGPLYQPKLVAKSQELEDKGNTSTNNNPNGLNRRKNDQNRSSDIPSIKKSYNQRIGSKELNESITRRMKLPAWNKRKELVDVINSNKVCLITGETGSGKSTQIVQFILDDLNSRADFETNIICTQPRRISTIGLAERISEERADRCGLETGYIIRGENRTGNITRLSFVTTGVLLRMIQSIFNKKKNNNKNSHDSFFDNLGYIFIDEVHERSIDSDFLLIILKKMMNNFPKLKIVLMSATIDVNIFQGYFNNSSISHVHIEGRTFPIKDYFLDDILNKLDFTITTYNDEIIKPGADSKFFKEGNINYDLISELIEKIDDDLNNENNKGSILIFLPGVMEIKKCLTKLDENKFWKLPLHSALSSNDQKRIFNNPPKNKRKIVASTNIAETSITIPDAVVVIDTGKVKSIQYDSRMNSTKLVEIWASKAEVGQRRGRAGRIQEGLCYKLYTKESQDKMLSQAVPEIKRTKLESIYLVVKAMGIRNVYDFLQLGLDPPAEENVLNAKQILSEIGALHNDELTSLGNYLSMLPTDLKSGKLLIFGSIFGCLESCLTLSSISVTGSPFIFRQENRDEIKKVQNKFGKNDGDMIAILNAFDEYNKIINKSERRRFLTDNFLSVLRLNEIESTRFQYLSNLQDLGFIPMNYSSKDEYFNRNNKNFNILKSILTSSSFPQIARIELPDKKYLNSIQGSIAIDPDARKIKLWIRNEEFIKKLNKNEIINENDKIYPSTRGFLHPSSTLFNTVENSSSSSSLASSSSSFVIYDSSQVTSKLYLYNITPTNTLSVLLFGGSISYDLSSKSSSISRGIIMDNWLPIRTWCKNAVLILKLRYLLDNTIREKLEHPGTPEGDDIIKIIEKLIRIN